MKFAGAPGDREGCGVGASDVADPLTPSSVPYDESVVIQGVASNGADAGAHFAILAAAGGRVVTSSLVAYDEGPTLQSLAVGGERSSPKKACDDHRRPG